MQEARTFDTPEQQLLDALEALEETEQLTRKNRQSMPDEEYKPPLE